MAVLKDDILPPGVYNTLPHIDDMKEVHLKHADDIRDLSALLKRYKLDDRVRIKLVHIHFQLKEGEVFAARDVKVPTIGPCNIMQAVPARHFQPLYGHHYFVNSDGDLAAYEYMSKPGPDMSEFQSFVQDFCQFIRNRGLQHTLGLSLRHSELFRPTNELEYPGKRVCIDVPAEVPLPSQLHSSDTTTEFLTSSITGDGTGPPLRGPQHVHHTHCSTYRRHNQRDDQEFALSNNNDSDGQDSSEGHTTSSSDDSYSDSDSSVSDDDSCDFDPKHGLWVKNGRSRQIRLAGLKLDPGTGLYHVVSTISDNA